MRYSVDATAVTALVTDVASCLGDAMTAATRAVTAVDDAAAALTGDAAGVRGATVEYVTGDEEMASLTSSAASAVPPLGGRGFGPAVF